LELMVVKRAITLRLSLPAGTFEIDTSWLLSVAMDCVVATSGRSGVGDANDVATLTDSPNKSTAAARLK
jgi:hypothetical protein